ncbi:MAG: hypothetical protein NVS3B12_33360 [Acidimicrobiales bacterium]
MGTGVVSPHGGDRAADQRDVAEVSQPDDAWTDLKLPPPVVMLADRPSEYRESVSFQLAMAGYPVLETGSISEALDQARRLRPDVMIISDRLATDDIRVALELLKDDYSLKGVPIITLSEASGPERLVECLRAGASDHVRQQDGTDELIARVDSVLRVGEELDRLRRRNAELEFLGSVDLVVGMSTRRQIHDELDRLSAGAVRHQLPLSVAMVRVDPWDSGVVGAPAPTTGDEVVEEVGFLLAAVRRTDDIAGVWDPRTFVVILPVTQLDGTRAFVERLRSVVAAAPIRVGDALVTVTLSAACTEVTPENPRVLERLERQVGAVQLDGGDGIGLL